MRTIVGDNCASAIPGMKAAPIPTAMRTTGPILSSSLLGRSADLSDAAEECDGFLASCFSDVEADSLNQLEEVKHPQRHTEATASVRVAPTSPVLARADRAHPR